MTSHDWKVACTSKIQGSWNLHNLLPGGMDFFICLSSLAAIIGNGGQANYAAANTYMDELVRYRVLRGERATTINLGWVESEGAVAENAAAKAFLAKNAFLSPVSIKEILALLEHYCDPQVTSPHQVVTGLRISGSSGSDATDPSEVAWMRKRTFRQLLQTSSDKSATRSSHGSETGVDYAAMLREAASVEDAVHAASLCLKNKLSKTLLISDEDVDISKPLHAYGVDSLLAVELRNYLARELHAEIAVLDMMRARSVEAASAMIAARSALRVGKDV